LHSSVSRHRIRCHSPVCVYDSPFFSYTLSLLPFSETHSATGFLHLLKLPPPPHLRYYISTLPLFWSSETHSATGFLLLMKLPPPPHLRYYISTLPLVPVCCLPVPGTMQCQYILFGYHLLPMIPGPAVHFTELVGTVPAWYTGTGTGTNLWYRPVTPPQIFGEFGFRTNTDRHLPSA
jgi:hypothetical protein